LLSMLMIFFNNLIFLAQAKSILSKKNWMINNIDVQYCNGIQFLKNHQNRIVFLFQGDYIRNFLLKINMQDPKHVHTYFEVGIKYIPLEAFLTFLEQ
jgi:hypothetical protein